MTAFIGTGGFDTIVPGFVSPGVEARGPDAAPDATPSDGDDLVAGGKGADTAALGAGGDTVGGSDRAFGQARTDRLVFDGEGSDEVFAFSAEGGEDRLDRDVGGVAMRLRDLERIGPLAGGGAVLMRVEGGAGLGGKFGGGRRDRVAVEDGDGASFVTISGAATGLALIGLPVFVSVEAADEADAFAYRAGGGVPVARGGSAPAGSGSCAPAPAGSGRALRAASGPRRSGPGAGRARTPTGRSRARRRGRRGARARARCAGRARCRARRRGRRGPWPSAWARRR